MNYNIKLINIISFVSMRNTLLDMTINNPIFIFSVITVIWFIPGILVRRINEVKQKNIKKDNQANAIDKLYPKK
tara:strand:+ start:21 stop:242 length:222 start_codon:yes stop_codon:yes gene_type:complete